MSDLQCPARVFLVQSTPDEARLRAIAERLRDQRVVRVYAGPDSSPATADLLAGALGADVELDDDLAGIADRHRGEAVVLMGSHDHGTSGEDPILVEVDSDGARPVPWDAAHD